MSWRWEVHESKWLEGFAELGRIDYVVVDLEAAHERPWLDAAREQVELIGHFPGPLEPEVLARALDLDVDFICAAPAAGETDARRLPLRLLVDQPVGGGNELAGAAWARRVHGWDGSDADRLAALARRERVFLAGGTALPPRAFLEQVQPFAVGIPESVSATDFARSARD